MLNTSFGLREHVIGAIMAQWSSRYKFVGDQADSGSSPVSDGVFLFLSISLYRFLPFFLIDFPLSVFVYKPMILMNCANID